MRTRSPKTQHRCRRSVSTTCSTKSTCRSRPLLKIDVEGHELAVLQGATQFLLQMKPALLLELHTQQSMVECLALLTPLKYKFRLLEKSGEDFIAAAVRGGPIPGFFICHIACVADQT